MPSIRVVSGAVALMFAAASATAQHAPASDARPPTSAPAEARQFDFLIGQWELEIMPKVSSLAALIHGAPKLAGTLKAWRGFDGFGVEDELRIYDGSGNPMGLNHVLRAWDHNAQHWNVVNLDVYRSRVTTSTAQWQGGEMRISGGGSDSEGKAYVARTRYFEIAPDHFRMQQDRSYDDGASWDEATLVIDAKRTAATVSHQ